MRLLPGLITRALYFGFQIRGGDLFRDPRVHGPVGVKKGYGHRRSAHKNKCAIDLNLMRNGALVRSTKGHEQLGTWWEKQHPLCRWGGRFSDGNHYSLEHNGVK